MRAIRHHDFGPADVLRLEDLPDPTPADGEVRISVRAVGVHLLDTIIRSGEVGPMPLPRLPTIPGREVAGVVDAVGSDHDRDWLGAAVVAHLGQVPGGYASKAVTATGNLFRLPEDTDPGAYADAVALVGTGRTALGILESDPVGVGDTVLVPSAAGGLGWLLVQAAQEAGARVVAAAGGHEKTTLLKALAPELIVDYEDPEWPDVVRREIGAVTVAYDGVGGSVGRAALELLAPGGRLVMFGWSSGTATRFDEGDVFSRSLSVSSSLGPRMAALPGGVPGLAKRALQRHAEGRWQPLVTLYPLADAAHAHADLENRRTVGKVVLRP